MAEKLEVDPAGFLSLAGRRMRCAVGAGGVVPRDSKREGDGATPAGDWPLRRLLYRPDREPPPHTGLPTRALRPGDGWCDDPRDERYNLPVRLPYQAGAERLWRADGVYDLLVVLGYNEPPATAGAGSAIFLHLAQPDFAPTRGCVALARADMLELLARVGPGDRLVVRSADAGR